MLHTFFSWIFTTDRKNAKDQELRSVTIESRLTKIHNEHKESIPDLITRLESTDNGLSRESSLSRLIKDGSNILTENAKDSIIIMFLKILFSGMNILLIVGALVSLVGYAIDNTDKTNLFVGCLLLFVVLSSALLSFLQELKSCRLMASFKNYLPAMSLACRDGQWMSVPSKDLVVGDLIMVEKGNIVPADMRLTVVKGLKVDNSCLTGESEPVLCSLDACSDSHHEARNMLFGGTLIIEGTAQGFVVRTGPSTLIGEIDKLVKTTKTSKSPVVTDIGRFIKFISFVAFILGITFFILSLLKGFSLVSAIVFMIGIIVANVPEGLVPTITVALALTANKVAKKKMLVKGLDNLETLGCTSVICTDKTGTLTQNKMSVAHLWMDDNIYLHNGPFNTETFKFLKQIACLCNNAFMDNGSIVGDATESALLQFCMKNMQVDKCRQEFVKKAEVPFNSTLKYQVALIDDSDNNELVLLKGAAETIINKCDRVMIGGKVVPLESQMIEKFHLIYEQLAGNGERAIGMAMDWTKSSLVESISNNNFVLGKLIFVGLVSLMDPPKSGVAESISKCKDAGIKVIMVTGDHPITARAIAEQVGIKTGETREETFNRTGEYPEHSMAIIVTGPEIETFDQSTWNSVLAHEEIIFARTSPQQKLLIVQENQRLGNVVAVTGDGVNDSAALKRADIGVSMGITGSDVSKDAANMILLDDNFSSIVHGIEQGRIIFDNLKKSIAYTLTSNIPEVVPFLLYIILGVPLPLTTILVLCIDIGCDMLPAIALAYEPPECNIMKRMPRNTKRERLVNWRLLCFSYLQIGLFQCIAAVFSYFYVMNREGFPPGSLMGISGAFNDANQIIKGMNWQQRQLILSKAQTAYFVAVIITQWADLIISKTVKASLFSHGIFNNYRLIMALLSETLIMVCIVYIPELNYVFGTAQLGWEYVWLGFPFALFIFVYDEIRKFVIRRNPDGFVARCTSY